MGNNLIEKRQPYNWIAIIEAAPQFDCNYLSLVSLCNSHLMMSDTAVIHTPLQRLLSFSFLKHLIFDMRRQCYQ